MDAEDWISKGVDPEDDNAQKEYANAEADRQLNVVSPRTLKLYGKMKNPANITPRKPTIYESELFDEDENEIEDNVYSTIYQEFQNTCWEFGADAYKATDDVFGKLDPSHFNANQLNTLMRDSDTIAYVQDDQGNMVAGDFIKRFFERIGHDGIIMDAHHHFRHMEGVVPGTEHHMFFNPNQLKSWTGNSGYYDHQNPVLTASRRIFLPPR